MRHSMQFKLFWHQLIKPKLGKALKLMMKHREIGDYSYVKKLNADEVKDDLEKAREILDAVRHYLKLDKT